MRRRSIHHRRNRLIQTVGVGLALGLAALVFRPQSSRAGRDGDGEIPEAVGTGTDAAAAHVRQLRAQVAAYRAQHDGAGPDLLARQWAQLLGRTDARGSTTARFRPYGPFRTDLPRNPLNGFSAVAAAPGDGVGYVYDAGRGRLLATGTDPRMYYDETRGADRPTPPQ